TVVGGGVGAGAGASVVATGGGAAAATVVATGGGAAAATVVAAGAVVGATSVVGVGKRSSSRASASRPSWRLIIHERTAARRTSARTPPLTKARARRPPLRPGSVGCAGGAGCPRP